MSNANLLIANANPDFKFVKCCFYDSNGFSKPYQYKTLLDVEIGQQVLVDSPSGIAIVKVLEVTAAIECEHEHNYDIKWIVDVINRGHYNDCVEMEKGITAKVNKMMAKRKQTLLMTALNDEFGSDEIQKLTTTILSEACAPGKEDF